MDITEGFLDGLFLSNEGNEIKNSEWICSLITEDPDAAQRLINAQLPIIETYAEKMLLLYSIKSCLEYIIKDLKNDLKKSNYRATCCSPKVVSNASTSIGRYQSALLRVNSAIEYELKRNEVSCGCPPEGKGIGVNLTGHQMTLAIHIFFKTLGIDTSNSTQVHQVFLSRFLHLIMGENCPEAIANSKYLDYLKNVPGFKRSSSKLTIRDLEAVRLQFERVRLPEAFPYIDSLLATYRKKQ